MSEPTTPSELKSILDKATEFHGHLGPFLVIGVRMGLIGLDRLNMPKDNSLRVTASLPLRVPFSCIIDGLQITTKCTVGNRKLSINDYKKIQAEFVMKNDGQKIVVSLNQSALEKLKQKLLRKNTKQDEIQELAWEIAKIPEEELFVVA